MSHWEGTLLAMLENKIHLDTDKMKLITRYVMAAMFVAFYIFFWYHEKFYSQISEVTGEAATDFLLKRIALVTMLCALGVVISIRKINLPDKINKWLLIAIVAITPFVSFFALEYTNIKKSRLGYQAIQEIGWKKSLATIVVLFIIMLGIYIASNSLKVAAIGISLFVAFFGAMCFYVNEFRGVPFIASDVTTAGTAINVMANYNYDINYPVFMLLLISLVWCVLIFSLKKQKGFNWKIRVGMAVVYVAIVGISVNVIVYTDFIEKKFRGTFSTYRPDNVYGRDGSIFAVLRSIKVMIVDTPEGYSVERANEIATQYPKKTVEGAVKPNVIVIMNEAFTDLQSIKYFETNKEVLPCFSGLKENVVRGDLYVSCWGGNTGYTEAEVLTGCAQAFLPPTSMVYQIFLKGPTPSFTTALKNQGYQGNIAMHPYEENGYNRHRAYPWLGFEQFLSIDDFKGAEMVRKYVSDKAGYDRIIKEYEEAKQTSDEPFYAFNVTMQNHTSYVDDYDNMPKDIKIIDEEYQDPEVERYLNLVNLSDQALEGLITYFEGKEEPTVVVFFGDHMPRVPHRFYKKIFGSTLAESTDEELMEKYKTPFMMWANYDIEEKENVVTSANYMSAIIMDSAKMQTTRWVDFLTATSKEMPAINTVGYYGADGNFYKLDDENAPHREAMEQYKILQHNYIFDRKNRVEEFFD